MATTASFSAQLSRGLSVGRSTLLVVLSCLGALWLLSGSSQQLPLPPVASDSVANHRRDAPRDSVDGAASLPADTSGAPSRGVESKRRRPDDHDDPAALWPAWAFVDGWPRPPGATMTGGRATPPEGIDIHIGARPVPVFNIPLGVRPSASPENRRFQDDHASRLMPRYFDPPGRDLLQCHDDALGDAASPHRRSRRTPICELRTELTPVKVLLAVRSAPPRQPLDDTSSEPPPPRSRRGGRALPTANGGVRVSMVLFGGLRGALATTWPVWEKRLFPPTGAKPSRLHIVTNVDVEPPKGNGGADGPRPTLTPLAVALLSQEISTVLKPSQWSSVVIVSLPQSKKRTILRCDVKSRTCLAALQKEIGLEVLDADEWHLGLPAPDYVVFVRPDAYLIAPVHLASVSGGLPPVRRDADLDASVDRLIVQHDVPGGETNASYTLVRDRGLLLALTVHRNEVRFPRLLPGNGSQPICENDDDDSARGEATPLIAAHAFMTLPFGGAGVGDPIFVLRWDGSCRSGEHLREGATIAARDGIIPSRARAMLRQWSVFFTFGDGHVPGAKGSFATKANLFSWNFLGPGESELANFMRFIGIFGNMRAIDFGVTLLRPGSKSLRKVVSMTRDNYAFQEFTGSRFPTNLPAAQMRCFRYALIATADEAPATWPQADIGGNISSAGEPSQLYDPYARRIVRGHVGDLVLAEEPLRACDLVLLRGHALQTCLVIQGMMDAYAGHRCKARCDVTPLLRSSGWCMQPADGTHPALSPSARLRSHYVSQRTTPSGADGHTAAQPSWFPAAGSFSLDPPMDGSRDADGFTTKFPVIWR